MTEQMYRNLPDELRPAKVIGQQGRVLEFETESSLTTFTAKGGRWRRPVDGGSSDPRV